MHNKNVLWLLTLGLVMAFCPAGAVWGQDGEEIAETGEAEPEPAQAPRAAPQDSPREEVAYEGELEKDAAPQAAPPATPPAAPPVPQTIRPASTVRRPTVRPSTLRSRGLSQPTVRSPRVAPTRSTPPPPRSSAPGVTSSGVSTGADDGEAPKTGETPTGAVNFDFEGAELLDVVEQVGRLTGENFDVDPNIAATTVTVITHNEIPAEMAYEVLESILATRGFSLVPTLEGNLIKVINTAEAAESEKTPLNTGEAGVPEGYDTFATHIVSVEHADASELATALTILGSKYAHIDTYAPTNTLIITDTADGLRRIFSFLDMADVPGFDTIMEIFTLEYSRAEVMSTQIEEVLADEGGGPGGGSAAVRRVPRRPIRTTRTVPGSQSSQVIGSREEVLRIVPDERLNALIVVASEGMMERVRDLIQRLDTPTPYEANNLHIYELLNADAEEVEKAIEPLLGTGGRRGRRSGGSSSRARPGTAATGGGASEDVQPFEQDIEVTRYDQTNALLVVASPQDYKILEAFIARLDVPQRQVLVDAVVMDVTISNDYTVSVEAAKITGNDGFVETGTTNLSTIASGLQPAADAANSIVSPGAGLALGVLGQGSGGGLTAGVFDDISVEIGGYDMKIPFVPLLFKAIETVSDLEVLSQPSLVTVDNEEASIVVGQEVPFITNTSRPSTNNQGQNIGAYSGYTRVQREEVGVKLKVTPQISEGDNVLLEIEIEVSDVANASQTVGDVNILGPTTNKSLIKNKVLVKNGATAVLAGLIRDTADRSRRQAPVLGDIPLLGWLFRSKNNIQEKRNMVILVTPHIVKESTDMDRVKDHKVAEYYDQNLQNLLHANFFTKLKKKREMRRDYRPTAKRAEYLTGRRKSDRFGRGDMER